MHTDLSVSHSAVITIGVDRFPSGHWFDFVYRRFSGAI